MCSVINLVQEVILIDSGSTDETVLIAKKLGVRVIFNKWPGYGKQKRFGEQICKNDWILNLDGDEVLSPELASSIRNVFEDKTVNKRNS